MTTETKAAKVVGCLVCGFRTDETKEIEKFSLNGCPTCPKVIEIKSMFIECREWFDKVNGNSYFSARVWVNGGQVAILPFQYGYGDQFIYEAQKKLTELGYLPEEPMHRGLWSFGKGLGFDYYTSKANTNKNQMFKLYENYQEEKVTISNKEKN